MKRMSHQMMTFTPIIVAMSLVVLPDGLFVWLLPGLLFWNAWMLWSIFTVDPETKARLAREQRVAAIREAEKELGLEPMDLAGDDPLEMYQTEKKEKEKEA